MFTGIVECTAVLKTREILNQGGISFEFEIKDLDYLSNVLIGDSLSINGACLTVVSKTPPLCPSITSSGLSLPQGERRNLPGRFKVTAVPETLRLTNLGELKLGDLINLERSLSANKTIGGHWIQGHVEAVLKILEINPDGVAVNIKISMPKEFEKYLVHKGFVGLDGMSLTIAGVNPQEHYFWVTLIPHTQEVTIAKFYKVGSLLNFEADSAVKNMVSYLDNYLENYLDKYLENFLDNFLEKRLKPS